MKKIALIALAGAMSLSQLNAQVEQGTLIIGGSIGINNSSSTTTFGEEDPVDGPKYSDLSIMPHVMYCLSDNFAVGIGIGYGSYSVQTMGGFEGDVELTDKETSFSFTPMARYYFVNDDRFMVWGALGIGIGMGTYTDEFTELDEDLNEIVSSEEAKISTMNIAVGPGASIMLGEKITLDFSFGSLGYSSYKMFDDGTDAGSSDDTEYKSGGFGINWANSFGFGISFLLD